MASWRQWWPILKLILALAIVGAVGWRFADTLAQLRQQTLVIRWEWLALGGLVYLLGLVCWGGFWHRLLLSVGERPPLAATARTYFIGHLGKYVPGKAWGLLLRTGMMFEVGVRPAVGALTATYETLTTMAAGTLLAVGLLVALRVDLPAGDVPWGWTIAGLLLLVVVPILPGVFNLLLRLMARMADRAAKKFGTREMAPLPRIDGATLQVGLLMTGVGWVGLGLSLWCVARALAPEAIGFSPAALGRYTAYVGLAYVAGFLAFVMPAGLGVREYLLQTLLARELEPLAGADQAAPLAVVVVLVLRLLWTVVEVMMAAIVYWLPVHQIALPSGSRLNSPAIENEASQ